MNVPNPKVDFYFEKAVQWQKELKLLRRILLDCGLTEELKWGCPCYTYQKNHIALLHTFKEYCAVLFFKGVLLADTHGLLVQQTGNVQAGRQMRFTQLREITNREKILKAFLFEAIEVEKAGLKVPLKKTESFPVPEEFQVFLMRDPELKKAFKALTPGRQRGYLLYFSAPKLAKTRIARVEKCRQDILGGKGLRD